MAVAKVHDAGFDHPDLYAKHVLVDRHSGEIVLLDWQRSRQHRFIAPDRAARDLAALNATLLPPLVGNRERLLFLQAYAGFWGWTREEIAALARMVLARTAKLRNRRHVREKMNTPVHTQQYIPLDGESLCVTPAFFRFFPQDRPDWLTLDGPPTVADGVAGPFRVPLGRNRCGLLLRRRTRSFIGALKNLLHLPAAESEEQRRSTLLLRLERHGVDAPRVLALGHRCGPLGEVQSLLVVETMPGTQTLADWLAHENNAESRRNGLQKLGRLLRQLHEACCYLPDRDFPLGFQQGDDGAARPVVTDAERLLMTRSPSPSLASRNLSAFDHQLNNNEWQDPGDFRALLEGYTDLSSSVEQIESQSQQAAMPGQSVTAMNRAMGEPERAAVACLEEAAAKPGPEVSSSTTVPPAPVSLWRRLWSGTRRLRQRADWSAFAGRDWPNRIMEVDINDRFHAKQGRSTCRWNLAMPGAGDVDQRIVVYLKRHYKLPWWRGLMATLWPGGNWSPALAEQKHLECARRLGVPVPEVVAAAEYIGPGCRLRSILAVEELTGMLPLHEAIPLAASRLDPATFRRWKAGLIAEMARLVRLLHDHHYFHKDLYLCHFFIDREDTGRIPEWNNRVFLIDLHRLGHHRWTWKIWQTKDLAQLLYSSEVPGIDARDRFLFWREYQPPEEGTGRSWVRWFVLFRWRRYRRHNARRKAVVATPA